MWSGGIKLAPTNAWVLEIGEDRVKSSSGVCSGLEDISHPDNICVVCSTLPVALAESASRIEIRGGIIVWAFRAE